MWKVYLSSDCTIPGIERALAAGIRGSSSFGEANRHSQTGA
jgi:hypothetical protein